MLTIERALSQYTDAVDADDSRCINHIIKDLPVEEHEEFLELAALIESLHTATSNNMKGVVTL